MECTACKRLKSGSKNDKNQDVDALQIFIYFLHFSYRCSPGGSTARIHSCTLPAPSLSVRSLSNSIIRDQCSIFIYFCPILITDVPQEAQRVESIVTHSQHRVRVDFVQNQFFLDQQVSAFPKCCSIQVSGCWELANQMCTRQVQEMQVLKRILY